MPKNAELLTTEGNLTADNAFLLEYQRCILLELEQMGILRREEVEKCLSILENQCP